MALIDDVKRICDRLADAGWRNLLLAHGIDIVQSSSQELADALDVEVEVDKSIDGFGDFINDRARGIEAGNPAASLLYHALASPAVLFAPHPGGDIGPMSQPVADFPTLEELDTIENYIFAKSERSVDDVEKLAAKLLGINKDSVELAVAVFASEYRPAPETPHQRYADLCLSRTGVARVGTVEAAYDDKLRGHVPFREGDPVYTIRVLPCLYVTWLAARSNARQDRFGPARMQQEDRQREFWVPVHKLFDGRECLKGADIQIELQTRHQNKKIERLHQRLENLGFQSGFSNTDRQNDPFIKEHGLASWLGVFRGGTGILCPEPQPLVERGRFNNAHLTFPSPKMKEQNFSEAFSPTLTLDAPPPPVRPWPEYAHVRFKVRNGNLEYFGNQANAVSVAAEGDYRALNLPDSTADGWVGARVEGMDRLKSIPAYSLLAAPDFFPSVDQREVYEWWENLRNSRAVAVPNWLQELIDDGSISDLWLQSPEPLSDNRFAPNITLPGSGFDAADNTVTAIVVPLQNIDLGKAKPPAPTTRRHAALPDAAAGIFAPGWDTGADRIPGSNGLNHLSAYGLGSPFPEDAKLCAALSTFWPAVAPDTARTYYKVRYAHGTVCPLTDDENGAAPGSVSWDGLRGPTVVFEDAQETKVRYTSYEYADYTLNALQNRFSIARTRKVEFREYTDRILATLRMYRALKDSGNRDTLHILSFRRVESSDVTLEDALRDTGSASREPVYRFDVFAEDDATPLTPDDIGEEKISVKRVHTLFIGKSDFGLLMARVGDGSHSRTPWQRINV